MKYKRKLFSLIITSLLGTALADNSPHTLNDAITYTLKTNPDVLISIRQRQQSDAQMRQDEAGYLPSIDISGQDGSDTERNQNTANTFDGTDQFLTLNSSTTTAAITENVFNGFRTYFNVRADLANIASKRYSVSSTAQNTALAVGEVYLNVLRAQQLVTIAQQNVNANLYTNDIISKRVQKGLSSESELQQSNGRLALARSDLLQELKAQQDAQAQFIQVVGVDPQNLLMPADSGLNTTSRSQNFAIKKAIDNNPALQASRYDLNSAIEAHKSTMSPYYPTVDVVASSTRGENIGGTIGPNDSDTVYVQANMNLFRGGADYQRYKETAYKVQEAFNTVQKTQREVVSNTALAWNAWQTSINDLTQLKIHKDESAKVVAAFRKQYVVGKRTLVDLLNAENESFRAQSAYVDGKFNILLNEYRLLNSEGLILNYFHTPLPSAATVIEDDYKSRNYHQVRDNTLYITAQPPINNSSGPGPNANNKFNAHGSSNVTNSDKPRTQIAALKPNYTVSLVPVIHPSNKMTAQLKPTSSTPKQQTLVSAEIKPNYSIVPVPAAKPAIKPAAKTLASLKPTYTITAVTVKSSPAPVAKAVANLKPNYTVSLVPPEKTATKMLSQLKPNYTVSPVPIEKHLEKTIAALKPSVIQAKLPLPQSTKEASLKPNYTVAAVTAQKSANPSIQLPHPNVIAQLPAPQAESKPKITTTYTVSKVAVIAPKHHSYPTTYTVTKVPKYS